MTAATNYDAVAAIFEALDWDKTVDYGAGEMDEVEDAVEGLRTDIKVLPLNADLNEIIPTGYQIASDNGILTVFERKITRRNPRRDPNKTWEVTQSIYVAHGDKNTFVHTDA